MKKAYTKPAIYIETFELMEHISRCSANPDVTNVTYRDSSSCAYIDQNMYIFYSSISECATNETTIDYDDFDDFDDFLDSFGISRGGCYNSFSDGNFFAS